MSHPDSPAVRRLRAAGFTVVTPTPGRQPTGADLAATVPGVVGWIAGVEPIGADVLAHADALKVISRNGAGRDAIDAGAADAAGVRVLTARGANAQGVAELALALALMGLRGLPEASAALRAGQWRRSTGREAAGRTLGVVGFGAIGRRLAQLARGSACGSWRTTRTSPTAGTCRCCRWRSCSAAARSCRCTSRRHRTGRCSPPPSWPCSVTTWSCSTPPGRPSSTRWPCWRSWSPGASRSTRSTPSTGSHRSRRPCSPTPGWCRHRTWAPRRSRASAGPRTRPWRTCSPPSPHSGSGAAKLCCPDRVDRSWALRQCWGQPFLVT
ncbi:NAD(P)-dependent oxidoreductase [Micromonospora echinospora]|uniref:NAD(P)-dependent oxidoreductase n=1 Tax=Micromonospora echinospora TaxID=1877 RepID=UPI003A863752